MLYTLGIFRPFSWVIWKSTGKFIRKMFILPKNWGGYCAKAPCYSIFYKNCIRPVMKMVKIDS